MPTLATGQSVLAVRPRFSWNRLGRGDIVVLRRPNGGDTIYIKRILGLPDEDIRLEHGTVFLGGAPLEEPYASKPSDPPGNYNREWWTGPGEYFVLGDNRSDSQDSRAFGPVAGELIIGRVWFRCWPPQAWGLLRPPVGKASYGGREG